MLHRNYKITVKGMACGGCESAIQNALGQLEGVTNGHADHVTGTVTLDYDDSVGSSAKIAETIELAGYEVVEERSPQIFSSTPPPHRSTPISGTLALATSLFSSPSSS